MIASFPTCSKITIRLSRRPLGRFRLAQLQCHPHVIREASSNKHVCIPSNHLASRRHIGLGIIGNQFPSSQVATCRRTTLKVRRLTASTANSPALTRPLLSKLSFQSRISHYSHLISIAFLFSTLLSAGLFLGTHELLERDFPTPQEWSVVTRWAFQTACALANQDCISGGCGPVQWGAASLAWEGVLRRLEDIRKGHEGERLVLLRTGKPAMETDQNGERWKRAGTAAYDISLQPEPWRRGYYDAIMGAARAAQELYSKMQDTSAGGLLVEKTWTLGPSNPAPKPYPPAVQQHYARGVSNFGVNFRDSSAPKRPLEENCRDACRTPDELYRKVLDGQGFTSGQVVATRLAWAQWLDYNGKADEAEEQIRVALDISVKSAAEENDAVNSGFSVPVSIDPKSFAIRISSKTNETYITSNILDATTALGLHIASQPNGASRALPILLSALRSYRNIHNTSSTDRAQGSKHRSTGNLNVPVTDVELFFSFLSSLVALLRPVAYPPHPPSGNAPLVCHSDDPHPCREAGLLANIGEVLFAISPSQRATGVDMMKEALGLAYDRASGEVSMGNVSASAGGGYNSFGLVDAKLRCIDAAEVALENLEAMVEELKNWRKARNEEVQDLEEFCQAWRRKLIREGLRWKLQEERSRLWATSLVMAGITFL